ncbi:hypothetical protein [Corynebacterium kroppenstedtii]|uniref:hypothetical protein n=1 Tax=Corynebacterium kroppenstedtii TaxID=161879 RepID=UPI003872AC92
MSQSTASLIVSFIALTGVLVTTWWNNWAADKRRREDQLAEEARRQADVDRREQERLEQLRREDWARQRRAVADCVAVLRDEYPPLGNLKIGMDPHIGGDDFPKYIAKGQELLSFYRTIVRSFYVAEIEISNVKVKAALHRLRQTTEDHYEEIIECESCSRDRVGLSAMSTDAIGEGMSEALDDLVTVAAEELLEFQGDDDNDK